MRLALIAHGLHPSADPSLAMSVMQAQQFVTARGDDPRLDPRMVADHLGISLRSLNLDVALSCGFRRRTAPP